MNHRGGSWRQAAREDPGLQPTAGPAKTAWRRWWRSGWRPWAAGDAATGAGRGSTARSPSAGGGDSGSPGRSASPAAIRCRSAADVPEAAADTAPAVCPPARRPRCPLQPTSMDTCTASVKVKVHPLDIAPLRSESPPQKRSGMARVLKGFHSFTCTPAHVHPQSE